MANSNDEKLFSIEWLGIAFALGLIVQTLGWIIGVGLLTGLPAYFIVGALTAWGSPGDTLIEPAVAAFLIATLGFMIDHLFLTLLVVGIPVALLYGAAGFGISIGGAYLGERILD
ncbi:hypothetical protein [Haloquadratum walsbyi]|uniref:DUF5518 domain-containing protein n=1 Tax=Haloquadratum walsbyi J07HQW2 TaxID=1238425 RepID=U1NCL3_9EURY|nr:hypothetical protein [Haloquadratum walsbyi]ERG94408.1 MAG: hypothetical protein J07HQW2_00842 [Haloquadratum walsbyi J07HQW2]